jgi:hypothetical protein
MTSTSDEKPADRLRRLRLHAGFPTAADAARAMKANVVTFQHHENGRRAISRKAAEEYGRFFGVAAGTILYGEALQKAHRVAIVGAVSVGGSVVMRQTSREVTVTGPPAENRMLVGLTVEADDLFPAYRRGDLVFYEPPGPLPPALAALNGRDCIVQTLDGRVMLRMLTHNGADRATLVAFAGPPMLNVQIAWAAPVLWVQRGNPAIEADAQPVPASNAA